MNENCLLAAVFTYSIPGICGAFRYEPAEEDDVPSRRGVHIGHDLLYRLGGEHRNCISDRSHGEAVREAELHPSDNGHLAGSLPDNGIRGELFQRKGVARVSCGRCERQVHCARCYRDEHLLRSARRPDDDHPWLFEGSLIFLRLIRKYDCPGTM